MFYIEDYLPAFMFLLLAVLLFTGFPVAWVIGGVGIAFGFIGFSMDLFSVVEFFNIVTRIYGETISNEVLVAITLFIMMGVMLEKSGIAEQLLRSLQILLRRVPGGLAISVTIMGTVMAATTGVIGASVVMLTVLALPVMLKQNYDKALATGTIAASGTLGILIPPSIMLVLIAALLAISVGDLFMAAVVPGVLLAILYLAYITIRSALQPHLAPPVADEDAPVSGRALALMVGKSLVPPSALILLVLGSIFAGFATPTEASGVGAFGAFLLAAIYRRLTWQVTREVLDSALLTAAMVFFIFIGATAFSYVFRSLGGDDLVVDTINSFGLNDWGILILVLLIVFILGFFLDWIQISLIIVPVFAPVIEMLNLGGHVASQDLMVWFGILIAVNLQASFLTPPFGFALFIMKGSAPKEITIQHIYRGIVPFVSLQVLGVVLVVLFPELALWLPRVVFGN